MTTKDYKNILNSFNSADFGEYSADLFINGNRYRKPTVYPSGSHPSILFTKNTVESVRKNILAEENREVYEKYLALSEKEWDGKFTLEVYKGSEEDYYYYEDHAAIMEAKAFRYAMTGEEKYGYEAIIAAKNAILTIKLPHTVGDWCRRYGYVMYIAACVYDWCYDLMSEEDKKQIIAGCVNLLGVHFEMCCFAGEGNLLPIEQGTMYGHGAEDQMLVDYLAFAIASYTEAPEIYEFVGGRVLNDYAEAQNFLLQSGSHWEGSMYGSCRTTSTIVSNILISKMTDDRFAPFTRKLCDVVRTASYNVRPDGQPYRIGDMNENRRSFQFVWLGENAFYAASIYKDAYLKSVAYKYLDKFTIFFNMATGLSYVQFLALNDPEIPHTYEGELPLTQRTYFPLTNNFVRSAHNDPNAFGIYMNMAENCSTSHDHMTCGSFQIYYKGPLASASGAYDTWGGPQHFGYAMQTVSSNSVLVYNPAFKDFRMPHRDNMVYSGGQSIRKACYLPGTLESLVHHPALGQCTSLGVKNCEENGKYRYSYMAGDMTLAYDEETVDEVVRQMLAFATDNEKCPYAFVTFDRITAKEKDFHKSALIHVQEEPKTEGDFVIVTTTKRNTSGKMVVQTVGEETEFTIIGGEGREQWIAGVGDDGKYSLEAGRNLPTTHKVFDGSIAEYGWGRIEVSPKVHEKKNTMFTLMYVTDQSNTDAPVRAESIESDTFVGAEIFGKAVMFIKDENFLSHHAVFTLKNDAECFIGGVKPGKWKIFKDGECIMNVSPEYGKNMLNLKLEAGTYKLGW